MDRPASAHVWLNGRLLPSNEPHLSVYDRGFQIGDGVFEALRARRGVPIELTGHLARLHQSLAALSFELPFGDGVVEAGIAELLAVEGLAGLEPPGDAVVRLTVSRGFDPTRRLEPDPEGRASVVIQAWPFVPPSDRTLAEGRSFVTSCCHRDPGSPISAIKSTSRAELVYAHLEAEKAGADDALFVTGDGRLTEATTANLLLVFGETCATPRLGTGLLAGTTRAWLMEHGREAGLHMIQRDVAADEVWQADEMASCSSILGVLPITSLDGRRIGDGRPGPRTMALRRVREDWIDSISKQASRDASRLGQ